MPSQDRYQQEEPEKELENLIGGAKRERGSGLTFSFLPLKGWEEK